MNKIEIIKEYIADLLDELNGDESHRELGVGMTTEMYVKKQLNTLWNILNNEGFPIVTGSDLRFKANRFAIAEAQPSAPIQIKTAYQLMQEQESGNS